MLSSFESTLGQLQAEVASVKQKGLFTGKKRHKVEVAVKSLEEDVTDWNEDLEDLELVVENLDNTQ